MKIGIITIHNSINYGASLQSYALWRFLKNHLYECELIDLYRPCHKGFIKSKEFCSYNTPKVSWKGALYMKFVSFFKMFNIKNYKLIKKFNEFNDKIDKSKPYYSIDQLYEEPPLYNIYITGSDQVWNPTQEYCIEPYFLTFVKDSSAKKISYAASIGIEELPIDIKNNFKKWLSSYDMISVRESQTKRFLESFIERNVYQVCDPTFLLEIKDWEKLAKKPQIKSYILVFTLSFHNKLIESAIEMGNKLNKKVIVINNSAPRSCHYSVIRDAGPGEWLGWIMCSDLVLTDSFHGTVFTLLFGVKDFYTLIPRNSKRGGRIYDLLEKFGLLDHIINDELLFKHVPEINRQHVINIINKEREKSKHFLLDNLK